MYSNKSTYKGNSFAKNLEVANTKGYTLVSHIGNCIFIKNKYLKKINIHKKYIKNPKLLYNDYWLKIPGYLYYTEYLINFILKNIKKNFK